MAALIPVPPMSTPIARGSPKLMRLDAWLTMVCELYAVYAILQGDTTMAEGDRARMPIPPLLLLTAKEQNSVCE